MKSPNRTSQRHLTWLFLTLGVLSSSPARAVYEPSQLADSSRRWSVDAGLSVGYDDNVYSANGSRKQGSTTTTLNPRLFLNIPLDQTFLGLRYSYDWIYYWERTGGEKYDQNHSADLIFSHRFNPRIQLDLTDNFRRGISPALVNIAIGVPYIQQEQGNYFYNNATATLTYNLSRLWTLSVYNGWEYWSYDNSAVASQDRNVYSPGAALNYLLSPVTTLGINFRMGIVDYRDPRTNNALNSTTETAFLSLSHAFNPQLSGQISAGGGVTELGDGHNSSSPYLTAGLTYRYAPNGTVTVGTSYFLYTSDSYGYRNSDTLATYLQFCHAVTQKLTARVAVSYIHSKYNDPDFSLPTTVQSNPSDDSWRLNLGTTYVFTRWLQGEFNYEFTHVTSDLSNAFDRNRVWVGLRVTY